MGLGFIFGYVNMGDIVEVNKVVEHGLLANGGGFTKGVELGGGFGESCRIRRMGASTDGIERGNRTYADMRIANPAVLCLRAKALKVDFHLLYIGFEFIKSLVDFLELSVDLLKTLMHSTKFVCDAFELRLDAIVEGFDIATHVINGALGLMELVLDRRFELLLIRDILIVCKVVGHYVLTDAI